MLKRLIILISTSFLFSSCIGALLQDPADAFVGNYTYTDNYFVRWGGDSKSSSLNGYFTLTKVSSNMVQMTGAWTTTGTVTGNTVQFTACPQSDSEGYVNYTFGSGRLSGNRLSFSYSGYGQRRYYGISYPWETSGKVVATKQ